MSSEKNVLLAVYRIVLFIILIIIFHHVIVSADNTAKTTDSKRHTEYVNSFQIGLTPKRDYLIVVNGQNEYQFDGEYDKSLREDLIYVSNIYGEPVQIEKGANLAFTLLKNYLREQEDIEIGLCHCYRDKATQQWYCEQNVGLDKKVVKSEPVDVPGHSERHTGLLLNIKVRQPIRIGKKDEYVWVSEQFEAQSDNPTFKTLHESLTKFGFIMRYPTGKEEITGSPYRPYEIRFVGSSEVASFIMDNKLTLEEYLKQSK